MDNTTEDFSLFTSDFQTWKSAIIEANADQGDVRTPIFPEELAGCVDGYMLHPVVLAPLPSSSSPHVTAAVSRSTVSLDNVMAEFQALRVRYYVLVYQIVENPLSNSLIVRYGTVNKPHFAHGFCGAHRTGKTTLAKECSNAVGIPFIETDLSSVFTSLSLTAGASYDIHRRLFIQESLLDHCRKQWKEQTGPFITDRTPIDLAAYMLTNIKQEELTEETSNKVKQYIEKCRLMMQEFFASVTHVSPGIPVTADPSKATASLFDAAVMQVDYMTHGVMKKWDSPTHSDIKLRAIPETMTDLSQRVKFWQNEVL